LDSPYTSLQVLLACFSLAWCGGLVQLLRSSRRLRLRNVISATLYSGLSGLIVGLLGFTYLGGQEDDSGQDLFVDAGRNIYLAGYAVECGLKSCILAHLEIYFRPTSLFNTLLMLVLLVGGLGLVARSLRAS
jgi:hypothetical protein